MIGMQLIELAQVAEQEHMNRALANQAAHRARNEAGGHAHRRIRRFRWFGRGGRGNPGRAS